LRKLLKKKDVTANIIVAGQAASTPISGALIRRAVDSEEERE
jgi:hypothetical protein